MDFSETNAAVLAIAADLCGYTKCLALDVDGTINWFGETEHPTDEEIEAKLEEAQADYDANGPLGHPDRGGN